MSSYVNQEENETIMKTKDTELIETRFKIYSDMFANHECVIEQFFREIKSFSIFSVFETVNEEKLNFMWSLIMSQRSGRSSKKLDNLTSTFFNPTLLRTVDVEYAYHGNDSSLDNLTFILINIKSEAEKFISTDDTLISKSVTNKKLWTKHVKLFGFQDVEWEIFRTISHLLLFVMKQQPMRPHIFALITKGFNFGIMGCARDRKGECIIVFNDSCGTEDEMNSQLFSRELHKEIAQDVTYKEAEYSYISVDTQQDCSKDMKKLLWFLQHDDEWFGIDADDTLMCTFEKWQENKNYLFKAIKRNDKEDDENYVPERIRWISKKKILGYGTSGAVEECAIEEIHGEGILHHETKITETSSAIQPSEISTVFTSKSPCFPCCVARKKFYHERTGDYLKEKTVLMNICTFIRSATSQSVEGEHKLSQMVLSLPFLSLVGFNDAERVLATFPVGSPVRVPFSRAAYRSLPDIVFQLKMLHQIGYVHGDVRPGNWIEVPGKDFTNREGEEELSSKNDILIESESVDNPVRLILIDYAMCSELSTDIATKPFPSDYVPKHHKSCFTRFGGSLGYASDSILRQMTSGSLESEIVFCAGDDLCAFVKSVLMARETNEERKMFDEIRMQVTRKAIKEGKKNVTLNDLAEGYRDYWEKKTISEFWLKMLSEAENEDYEAIIEDLNTLSKQEDECVS